MPQRVVDQLEPVQVHKEQCAFTPMPRTGGQRLVQAVQQKAAIGKLGQGIVVSKLRNFFFGRLALCDVGQGGDIVGQCALC